MKRLYFFDKQFNYKNVITVNNVSPIVDIISTQNFKITTPLNPDIIGGDICIFKNNNEVIFIGTVLNVEDTDKNIKTITITYIDELFNINGEIEDLNGDIATWITDTLTTNFVSTSDNLQKINLTIVDNCNETYTGSYIFEDINIKNCLKNIFDYSGMYVDFDIDFADNGAIENLICNIRNNAEENTVKLKYNMPIISDIKRTVTNSQNVNKLVLLPDETVPDGNRYEFYLLKDGSISTQVDNENRFENVKQEIQYYDENFTAESLLNSAKEVLGGQQFNHSIGFYILHNDAFNISIYKKILFYDKGGIVYNSIITKIQYGSEFDYVELGVVRLKLTDKLQKTYSKVVTSASSIEVDNLDSEIKAKLDLKSNVDGSNLTAGNINSLVALICTGAEGRGEKVVDVSFGTNGYIKYASGLIIQWGRTGAVHDATIYYPISFSSSTSYSAVGVSNGWTGSTANFGMSNLTASSFYFNSDTDYVWLWIAIGY